jgi:hypothetical protein
MQVKGHDKTVLPVTGNQGPFQSLQFRFICKVWPVSLLLGPYPAQHYHYGFGSRKAKINAYLDTWILGS